MLSNLCMVKQVDNLIATYVARIFVSQTLPNVGRFDRVYAINREIFIVVKIFSYACATTKIKHTKYIFRVKNVCSMALPRKKFKREIFSHKIFLTRKFPDLRT